MSRFCYWQDENLICTASENPYPCSYTFEEIHYRNIQGLPPFYVCHREDTKTSCDKFEPLEKAVERIVREIAEIHYSK